MGWLLGQVLADINLLAIPDLAQLHVLEKSRLKQYLHLIKAHLHYFYGIDFPIRSSLPI